MYLINNKMNKYLWFTTLALFLLSCNNNNSIVDPETTPEFQVSIVKLLSGANMHLLEKAPLVDNDIAAIHHYEYADSLIDAVIHESDNFEFERSLAKLYNAGAHIFYGMSYRKTIYLSVQYPIMNFIEVRKNIMANTDSLLSNYLIDKKPLTLIQLKNAWMLSMIEFMKVDKSPVYDHMKNYFTDYLMVNDSITNTYNKGSAYKILILESEKELYRQLTYLTVDVVSTSNKDGKTAFTKFMNEGLKYAAIIDKIPVSYQAMLSLTPTEYYQHFYYSEIVVYNLFLEINKNI